MTRGWLIYIDWKRNNLDGFGGEKDYLQEPRGDDIQGSDERVHLND